MIEAPSPDAPPTIGRPPSVDYLMADYGTYAGLTNFAFDEDNEVLLEVEDVDLLIEYVGAGAGFLLQSVIQTEAEIPAEALYEMLNSVNAVSFRNGAGMVLTAPGAETASVIWQDRLRVENLSVEMLDEAIKRAVTQVDACTQLLQALLSQEGEEAPATEAAATELNPMIRI